jgi:hypothetical protein
MIRNILNSIWSWFSSNSHPLTIFRTALFFLFFLLITRAWLKAKRKSQKTTEEEEEIIIVEKFEKNEEGKYPWEENTDDDPKHIGENAKPVSLDTTPQRGRWKV